MYAWNETAGVFEEGTPVQEEQMVVRYYGAKVWSVKEVNRVVMDQIVGM